MRARRILMLGLVVALGSTALAAFWPAAFSFFDLRIYDAMLRASTTRPPSKQVAVVAIDDRSLSEIGQWPWTREIIAKLIERLRASGARVVAIDVLLSEPDRFMSGATPGAPSGDARLGSALAGGRVVMSYALTFNPQARSRPPDCLLHPLRAVLVAGSDRHSPQDQLFHATSVVCSLADLSRAAGSSGYLNASPDRDGVLRRIPMVAQFNGQIYPSLALAAVLKSTGTNDITLTALAGERSHASVVGREVPLDEGGTLLIRFRGRRGTYPYISASDVLAGRLPPGALTDRIVFVGATALGVQDVVNTPFDTGLPGIEVHANAADTLLQGDFLSTPPYWRVYELAGAFAFGLAPAVLAAVIGFLYGSLSAAALLGLLWIATFRGVNASGVFLSPVFPSLGMFLGLVALTIEKVRHERRRADTERGRRERAHQFAVQSLTSLMETRDRPTGEHARRTQQYSHLLASRLALVPRFREYLTPERVDLIAQLSPLHDIGKVGVRDAVLNKPGALSDEEAGEMRRHPGVGYETIERAVRLAGSAVLANETLVQIAKDVVYTHHERWDGLGYPRGLKGDEIPIAGRIVALVDVYDALSHSRTYRKTLSHDEAVATIVAGRATHFDPDVVDAFLAIQERFRDVSRLAEEGVND